MIPIPIPSMYGLLSQWLNFKLLGITYLVGEIKFFFFFRVHWLSEYGIYIYIFIYLHLPTFAITNQPNVGKYTMRGWYGNSIGLYTPYKDSIFKVGWPSKVQGGFSTHTWTTPRNNLRGLDKNPQDQSFRGRNNWAMKKTLVGWVIQGIILPGYVGIIRSHYKESH